MQDLGWEDAEGPDRAGRMDENMLGCAFGCIPDTGQCCLVYISPPDPLLRILAQADSATSSAVPSMKN